ncbi:UPF0481 protein [Salix suchowensis]|nr:UPF0481 protein [Salix suchowensis]
MFWNCDEGYNESNNAEWKIQIIWRKLEGSKESPPPKDRAAQCCICGVPNSLRVSNPEAYTPQLISIGPFHHDRKKLKAKETLKRRYQGEFTKRNEEKKIKDFLRRIYEEEESIRLCYSESFLLYRQSFVEMIVLDAVFIIEFLMDSCFAHHFPKNIDTGMRFCIGEDLMLLENQLPFSILDLIYSEFYHSIKDTYPPTLLVLATHHFGKYPLAQGPESIRTTDKVQHFTDLLMKSIFGIGEDLMLLENQLPFTILDLIYSEFYHHSQDENETPFLDLATRHFGKYPLAQGPKSICTTDKVQHFTDLLMKFMLKGALKRENRPDPIKLKYNAAMLRKAGVKFQKTEDKCLFNVRFEKGVLEIPILKVDDSLERVVLNVMAWERCSKPGEAYICNYFKFMDHLINTAEDVELLIEEGIILNSSYYSDICQQLNEYYENPWNRSKATLKLVYFSNLWRGTGTVAAAFLLILTLIQTITSLKSAF